VLKIGEKISVEVISVDHQRQRVSLSIKGQQADPWQEVTNAMGQGDEVDGTITRIKHFGAFVEVYPGVEALLPIKELSDYERTSGDKLGPGSKIRTTIIKFNPEERRISLSLASVGEARETAAQGAE
jgi:small subunit ribosomal protein S1